MVDDTLGWLASDSRERRQLGVADTEGQPCSLQDRAVSSKDVGVPLQGTWVIKAAAVGYSLKCRVPYHFLVALGTGN